MAGLKARCDADGLLLPPTLKIGDRIRILSGPFADLVTTIESLPGPQAHRGVDRPYASQGQNVSALRPY